jgi:hypothetical protein
VDPDPHFQYGSGSGSDPDPGEPNQCGSGSTTLFFQILSCFMFDVGIRTCSFAEATLPTQLHIFEILQSIYLNTARYSFSPNPNGNKTNWFTGSEVSAAK